MEKSYQGLLFRLTPNGILADHGITDVPMSVNDVKVTSEGKIVVVGVAVQQSPTNFLVARFLPNGRPDTSFGRSGSGWTLTDVGRRRDHNIAHGVAVQRDGRILVTGESLVPYGLFMTAYSFATVRYNVDGSLDNSFGDDGRVITRMGESREDMARAVLILPDGKIVVAGSADSPPGRSDFALARYLPNGQLDMSFGRNGKTGPFGLGVANWPSSAAWDTHQRVVVGGVVTLSEDRLRNLASRAPALVRYNIDGSLDQSFGNGGVVALEAGEWISAVAVQPDAKIVAVGDLRGGKCGLCFAAIRLNADGNSDKSFADDGVFALPFDQDPSGGRGIAIQEAGKLVLAAVQMLR